MQPEPVNNHRKKNVIIVLIIALLITFPTVPFLLYQYGINEPVQTDKIIGVEIKPGSSVSEIAFDLKDAGLINSPLLFKVYLKINRLESNMQAGVYEIPPMTSLKDLVEILQFGRNDVTITFYEGWRVEQLAQLLSEKLDNINYKEFVTEARDLEGYLFPDTYFFAVDSTQKEVIDRLEDTFKQKTKELLSSKSLREAGLKEEEAVILASIIEREAVKYEDRQIIAGILIYRLRQGAALEADATTQYSVALDKHCVPDRCRQIGVECTLDEFADLCRSGLVEKYLEDIKWWPHNLTEYDLDFDSPYNTRKVAGLPPAPISSFSLSALEAVINHIETDYYFYMTDGDGVTHYTRTLDEHNNNVFKYLR